MTDGLSRTQIGVYAAIGVVLVLLGIRAAGRQRGERSGSDLADPCR